MKNVTEIAWLIPLLPFIGFLINGLLRKQLPKAVTSIVGCGVILVSFAISFMIFLGLKSGEIQTTTIHLFNFITVGKFSVPFSFLLDSLSALFLMIITGVGFLIHVYSTAYMHSETSDHFARYFSYLNLFVFFMLLLVLGSNYVILFIGWEGVGLCSYLLIGYWFKNTDYNNAAKKAFIMNRIGDLGFLIAIFWMINQFGSTNFADVFGKASGTAQNILTGITLLLFVGAVGKSAQIPLFTWLPDAMAGPTPVSALIHAATMVTAGIYMVARSNVLFSLAPVTMEVVAIIGLATALLAASIAIYQNDIKKVLAYSTVSQLGFMFLALGVGAYSTAVFHVMTHAFFKALLFLGAGSVIHAMSGEQDITKMGGLRKKIPITHITFVMGVIAISGIPFTSGFMSKDEILIAGLDHSKIYFWLATFGAILTAFYMFRLLMLTFYGSFRGTKEQEHHLHESPPGMTIPLMILALLSLIGGFVQLPHVFGGHPYLNEFLGRTAPALEHPDESITTTEYALLGGSVVVLAIIIYLTYRWFAVKEYRPEYTGFKKLLANKWYIDEIYDTIIVKPVNYLAKWLKDFWETEVIDWLVNGVGRAVQYTSRQMRLIQSGQVGSYVLLMVLSILVFFALQFFIRKS